MRALLPIIATLDDHEFADGAWREGADNHHEDEFGPWSVRKAAAFKAREEAEPIRRPDPDDVTRVFRSITLGDLADLVLTDGRSRRDKPVPPPEMDEPGRTALGAEQKAFLIDAITTSTAPWRLWGNPSMLSTVWKPGITDELLEQALLKLKLVRPDGQGCDPDQWDGYPAERDSILAAFEEAGVHDLVVLSGDIHVGVGTHVHRDPFTAGDADPIAVEMVTASITSQNLDDKLGYPYGGSAEAERRFLAEFPHMQWANFDGHGYMVIDVDRDRVEGSWWFVDSVLSAVPGEHRAARAQVRRGTPRLEILEANG
jgi:alkaline phosphatase D